MRITNNMIINRMMSSLNTNLDRMSKVQNQLSTGKKISLPSDDPMIASRALKYRSDISEMEQYSKNAEDATSWTDVTDSALNSIQQILQRARELAVQASSDTNTATERDKMKEEADQLRKQLIKLANTSYAGRYIFSGFKTDQPLILENSGATTYTDVPIINNGATPPTAFRLMNNNISSITNIKGNMGTPPVPKPFTIVTGAPANSGEVQVDTTTGQLTFFPADVTAGLSSLTATYTVNRVTGDYNAGAYSFSNMTQTTPMQNEDIKFEIGIGDKIEVNVIGTKVFGDVTGSGNVGSNIQNFMNFVTSLASDDVDGIKASIENIDEFMNSVLQQRADVGARANRLDLTTNRLGDSLTNFTELMSKNEDADMAEVIMNLKNEENVYKASLEAGARIIQPTLIDFLR